MKFHRSSVAFRGGRPRSGREPPLPNLRLRRVRGPGNRRSTIRSNGAGIRDCWPSDSRTSTRPVGPLLRLPQPPQHPDQPRPRDAEGLGRAGLVAATGSEGLLHELPLEVVRAGATGRGGRLGRIRPGSGSSESPGSTSFSSHSSSPSQASPRRTTSPGARRHSRTRRLRKERPFREPASTTLRPPS